MSDKKGYQTPVAFRRALEDRLKRQSREDGVDLQRLRRSVAFDRLLCRLFFSASDPWILKGGYAMELRIHTARATKDIDLTLPDAVGNDKLLEMLQEAAGRDLEDYFVFTVGSRMLDLDAAPEGGSRFPVTCSMAGKPYVKFHVDLGMGDVAEEPFEMLTGLDWLSFAGIPRGFYRGLSKESQFAEKLHAFTLPRDAASNSRVKDLVDLVLLIQLGLNAKILRQLLAKTFEKRNTHLLPPALEKPPDFWAGPYAGLAQQCNLPGEIHAGFAELLRFYQKVQATTG